jgi:CARDB
MVGRRPGLFVGLLLAALLLALAPASAQGPVSPVLSGPAAAGLGAPASYDLTITGGPASANYTVQYYITGADTTGGLPLAASPASTSGARPAFKVNITAPTKEGTITLVVKVSASGGGITENGTVEKAIVVITPIVLSTTFRNSGPTAALNVTVRFYVDDAVVGTRTIARIDAGKDALATYNYLPVGLQPGTHHVRIEADLDGNGVIDAARGEAVTSQLFYKGTPGLSPAWTVLIGIAVFIPVLLVTMAIRRRRQT